jgi:hypothetical protein
MTQRRPSEETQWRDGRLARPSGRRRPGLHRPKSFFRHFFCLTVISLTLFVSSIYGQNPRGTLVGRLLDSTGARVAGAVVELTQSSTSLKRQTAANREGEFEIQSLLPGHYEVRATAPGFAEAAIEVDVAVSSTPSISLTLTPERVKESVEVKGKSSPLTIETTSNEISTVLPSQELESVPLAHRSFANIAFLAPMTAPVEPSDPTKARITAVSFAGSSGLDVDVSVDGGDNNDDYIGGFLQNYSPEAIEEFSVRTAQMDADTSRTNGGSVIISTRRGTNDWHGSSSLFVRNTALNARNTIDNPEPDPKQPYSREDAVLALGGPIKRDRLWFFSSLEYVNEDGSVAYSANSQTQFNALSQLALQGLIPGISSIPAPQSVGVPFRDTLFTARFDYTQSPKSQWFLRGSLDRNHTENDLVQQATLPSTGAFTRSNYYSVLLDNQYQFSPNWLGNLTLQANGFDHSKIRNSHIGQALAFPFSATNQTISGFETYGDNQFATPITAFPVLRDQQKYQVRYDVSHAMKTHSPHFGINFVHEPVFGGALAGDPENLHVFPNDPSFYLANPSQFADDYNCIANASPGTICQPSGAVNGRFSQNVQRLGAYAQDSSRITPSLTLNYGLRYDTTFGLFNAEGHDQSQNWAFQQLQSLGIPLANGIPHDYRKAFGPRLGIAYAPGGSVDTVIRAGIGVYYNDLSQNGWVNALQSVNGGPYSGQGAIIDPHYRTPYALQTSAAVEHRFGDSSLLNIQFEHQEGNHQYQRYEYVAGSTLPASAPNVSVFRSGNRSSYNGVAFQVEHRFSRRFELNAHYTLASATTWGATLGELFDYVNGVSSVNNGFGSGDHGPSGEDVRHRAVISGVLHLPGAFEVSTISQFESARPFTLTTPVDINNDGNSLNDRAVINGVQTTMDELRGKGYMQVDLRVTRPIKFGERVTLHPFAEFFNLFNRSNAGANYVTNIAALPTPVDNLSNATALCMNPPACNVMRPITSLNQLRVPAGTLGDFFGPGTNVGIPFAAQIGFQLTF